MNGSEYSEIISENSVKKVLFAGFTRRASAFIIDHLVIFILLFIIVTNFPGKYLYKFFVDDFSFALIIFFMVLFLQIYFLIFELLAKGLTPGKWIFNIRVVNEEFKIPDLFSLLIRNFSRCLYFIPPFFFFDGYRLFFYYYQESKNWRLISKNICY